MEHSSKGVYLSNKALPENDRTDFWREAVSPLYDALEVPSEGAAHIDADIRSHLLGERLIVGSEFGRHRNVRNQEWLRRRSIDYYYIQLFVSGGSRGVFGGREDVVSAGDIHITSVMTEVDAVCSNSTATISLMLAKEEFEYICGKSQVEDRIIRAHTAMGKLIGSLFGSAYREAGGFSFNDGVACGDALLNLLAATVKHDHDNIHSAPSEQLRNQVLDFIIQNINNPKLDVNHILERFALSRSHLYRLLEQDGGAASLIRKQRLQLARNDLIRYKDNQQLRVKEIAFKYGFSNTGQFVKSFQQEFSISPTELLKRSFEDESNVGQLFQLQRHLQETWSASR